MSKKGNKLETNTLDSIIDNTFNQIKNIVDANTIIGEAIKLTDNILIIPVSKVSVGLISGGGEDSKNKKAVVSAGSSTGFTITPIGFVTINDSAIDFIGVTTNDNATSMLLNSILNLSEKLIARGVVDNEESK